MKAYEEAINETSRDYAPWFVVPADKKWFARVSAIQIIIDALQKMNLKFPTLTKEELSKFDDYKAELDKD